MIKQKRKTLSVKVGNVLIGGSNPIAIQSMTNTRTSDIKKTTDQIIELINAGSDLVRFTINDDQAAIASIKIINLIRSMGHQTPLIGDFHFNGHILLEKYPECARLLDKYRINPGNVGTGINHDKNFESIIKIAIKNNKAIRIGVNAGSIDQAIINEINLKNSKRKNPKDFKAILIDAMIQSAINSATLASKIGLPKNNIILSVKMSEVQDLISVYEKISKECNYALHLGLTEAGSNLEGITSSVSALSILLQQGIGDTIRISLTPTKNSRRSQEVEVCKSLLQSLGLRYFEPKVISCPGCGRTKNKLYLEVADKVKTHIKNNINNWQKKYKDIEKLKIAVMGCVVNGPGESKHADLGISLPGNAEKTSAIIFADGKKVGIINNEDISSTFIKYLDTYIKKKY